MTYTFFISTASSVTYQVYPLNWLDCSLVDEKEQDQQFYRRKFEGELTFGGKKLCSDFNLFYGFEQIDPCQELYLFIFQDGDSYWEGYFSTSMGQWDLDSGTFTVTPLVIDDYSIWEQEGDKEYNILTTATVNGIAPITHVTSIYNDGITIVNYTRTMLLTDVISYLARQVFGIGVTIVHDFFTNATNPITLNTNRYRYLTIAQKSDIKFPTSSNPATIGNMTFNELMEILKCMNLNWQYDGTTLTIEHVSHWTHSPGLDIRTQEMTVSTNKYKYLKEEMPKYEYFKWMEAENEDFVGLPIWYDSLCVNQDSGRNSTEFSLNVTTDIEYIQQCVNAVPSEESKISNEGWVLLANNLTGGSYYIYSNYGFIEGIGRYNMDMSWGRLHISFFKFERQLMTGYMNGGLTSFVSTKKTKVQECSIFHCTDFDPDEYIVTELGQTYFNGERGYVRKATIKPYGEINLELVYGPVPELNPGTGDIQVITITEKTGLFESSDFYANLTVPSTTDLTVDIDIKCHDAIGNTCTTGYITLTILAGNLTGTVNIPWCTPVLDPAICIDINDWDSAGAPGWTVVFGTLESSCV